MKKIFTLSIIILLLGARFNAMAGDKTKFGIRAGYQVGNLYDSQGSSLLGNYNTFYVGLYKDVKLIPLLFVGAGLEYYQNGSVNGSDNKIGLHYLSIPFDVKLKVGPFFALAGVGLNFKVHEKWVMNGDSYDPPSELQSNGFDLPLFAGVGMKFAMITIEARYFYGTRDVNGNSLSGFEGYHNSYLQLGLGLSI
jgi:hypothetical protein